jgi:hypothetical protein
MKSPLQRLARLDRTDWRRFNASFAPRLGRGALSEASTHMTACHSEIRGMAKRVTEEGLQAE